MGCRVWAQFKIRKERDDLSPVLVEVRYWLEHGRPAILFGPPDKCRPGEGFETEVEEVVALGENGKATPFDFSHSDWDEIYEQVDRHAEEHEATN